jgi:hypothetical protein
MFFLKNTYTTFAAHDQEGLSHDPVFMKFSREMLVSKAAACDDQHKYADNCLCEIPKVIFLY